MVYSAIHLVHAVKVKPRKVLFRSPIPGHSQPAEYHGSRTLEGDELTDKKLTWPRTIWIIGPPCVGKTTLARLLVDHIRADNCPAMLLDGDDIRKIYDTNLGYDPASRRKQTVRVQKLAQWVISQDVLPVVAINHPFEEDRAICRDALPGYFEISLDCELKERIRRDNKKLYLPALRGEKRHVVGVDIPFEEPKTADLVLNSEELSPEELLNTIIKNLSR